VCEELSDAGHIFVVEIANCTSIPMFSMHQHVEAAIMAANKNNRSLVGTNPTFNFT
jgi:aspartate/glutamate racemase